ADALGTACGLLATGSCIRPLDRHPDAHRAARHRRARTVFLSRRSGDGRPAGDGNGTGRGARGRHRTGAVDRGAAPGVSVQARVRWVAAGDRGPAGLRRTDVVGPDHRTGTGMSWAAVFLALALLAGADPARVRSRVAPAPGPRVGPRRVHTDDPLAAAS